MSNQKQTLELGDRVLGHNGITGYVVAIDGDSITIESTRYGRFVSPRSRTFTTEAEPLTGATVHCLECGCALPSGLSLCRACGGF